MSYGNDFGGIITDRPLVMHTIDLAPLLPAAEITKHAAWWKDRSKDLSMLKLTLVAVAMATIAASSPVQAQDVLFPGMPGADVDLHGASGVFHGNYCGVGNNGPGKPPVDDLDLACMHHDACTPTGRLPTCACNARFQEESHAVAVGSEPDDLKALAALVEAAVPVIPCR